jgi:capsular exopolysaccharide synthesis family protein
LALVFSATQKSVYSANARVLVQASAAQNVLNPFSGSNVAADITTDLQLFTSSSVTSQVRQKLGYVPVVTASQVGTTNVIEVTATAPKPQEAADIANVYGNVFVNVRQNQDAQNITDSLNRLEGQASTLQSQINTTPPGPQRDALVAQQASLNTQIQSLRVGASVQTDTTTLTQPATPNFSPVSPKTSRNVLLGLIAGALLGCGVAFLREYLDDTVKSAADLTRASKGAPTLGVVPVVRDWSDASASLVVSMTEPRSPAAEAYRSLRTSLQFLVGDDGPAVLQVTSARPGEGKTTTVSNLAVALARAGKRVAVVDCDLRRPRLHSFFGVSNAVGLTSVVHGMEDIDAAVRDVPGEDGIFLLPSGPIPPNPSELIAGGRAAEVLRAMAANTDVVLVDSPPLLAVSDSATLGSIVDGTILVTTAGSTTRGEVSEAVDVLRKVEARTLGIVLNAAPKTSSDGYSYYYEYGERTTRYSAPASRIAARRQSFLSGVFRRRSTLIAAGLVLVALFVASLFPAGRHGGDLGAHLAVGLVVGLLVATTVVTVLERRRRIIKSVVEVERRLGCPVLGAVPVKQLGA